MIEILTNDSLCFVLDSFVLIFLMKIQMFVSDIEIDSKRWWPKWRPTWRPKWRPTWRPTWRPWSGGKRDMNSHLESMLALTTAFRRALQNYMILQ